MRIAAVSDLHGYQPEIPACDLLLIAGDICPDFLSRANQRAWFVDRCIPWLKKQPVKDSIYLTWGNHDWLPKPSSEWAFRENAHFIKVDELVEHPYEDGMLRLWFSPWSNQYGSWAWMAEPSVLDDKYAQIPPCDILVSHQPPYGYGDQADPRYCIGDGLNHLGSLELRDVMDRLRPDILICGHIHGGYGTYTHGRTTIHNVALVNEAYKPVNPVTLIDLP